MKRLSRMVTYKFVPMAANLKDNNPLSSDFQIFDRGTWTDSRVFLVSVNTVLNIKWLKT